MAPNQSLPDASLNIAANFLYMLKGEKPSERDARIFDVCLILHADHELNASTFTARVVAGTLADMYAAITAAIGALSGPLHGGANTAVMKTLLEIGSVENVEPFIKQALSAKRKMMGFGHAVYKTEDPRATHLRKFSKEIAESAGDSKWYEMSRKVEEVMMSEKGLYPNVDFYSASTYYMMGIPLDLYTPIFAVSRISGWDRPRARAVRRQQTHSPASRIHRRPRPALGSDGKQIATGGATDWSATVLGCEGRKNASGRLRSSP
jgi:citrate synthase